MCGVLRGMGVSRDAGGGVGVEGGMVVLGCWVVECLGSGVKGVGEG